MFYGKGADVDLRAKIRHFGVTKYSGVYELRAVADSCLYHFAHIGNNKVGFEPGAPFYFQKKWGMTVSEFWRKVLNNE
jgi:hypothetical protein